MLGWLLFPIFVFLYLNIRASQLERLIISLVGSVVAVTILGIMIVQMGLAIESIPYWVWVALPIGGGFGYLAFKVHERNQNLRR